jgi:hypothetical protein
VAKGADNAAQGKYNKAFVWILAAIGVYILVKGWSKTKQQTYLDTAGTDKATQQAQALRDAFNRSGFTTLMKVDGTDVDLVMSTARQITDYSAVSDSYRVIFPGSELTTDLQDELSRTDLQTFYDIVYKRGSNPTVPATTPTTTTPSTGTTTGTVHKQVKATQTVNIRDYANPFKVLRQAKAGEVIGTYTGEKTLNVTGQAVRFYLVEKQLYFGLVTEQYYVAKSSVVLV